MKHVGGPFFERLFLPTHLVTLGQLDQPLTAQLAQQVVHVRTERAEVGVRTRTQAEHGKSATDRIMLYDNLATRC